MFMHNLCDACYNLCHCGIFTDSAQCSDNVIVTGPDTEAKIRISRAAATGAPHCCKLDAALERQNLQ